MALPIYLIAVNYAAWFVFMFISVVWILVMLDNRGKKDKTRTFEKLPAVSILIPAYNEGETIGRTIESVLSLDYPKRLLDVIVINDCSTDKTKEIAEKFAMQGKIRLLNNTPNRGKAYSLNRALKFCRGEFVACIDADSIVERAIIKKLLSCFHEDRVAAVAPALKVWKSDSWLEKVQTAEYVLNTFLRKILSFMDAIHVTPGVFSMYRLNALKEADGFDENNLTEDMDMALKLHDRGYIIETNLNAMSYTMCPGKWRELYRQRLRWYRGGIANTVKYKHMLFNPAYGNLGMFFLPVSLISVLSIMAVFSSIVYTYFDSLSSFAWRLSLINFDFLFLIGKMDLSIVLEEMMTTSLVLGAVGMALGGCLLWASSRSVNSSLKSNAGGYLLYLLLFPFIMMVFWTSAIMHEIAGARKRW